MKKLRVFLLIIVIFSVAATTASAMDFTSASNRFSLNDDVIASEQSEGDYVAFGETVKLEAGVTGDIIAGGRNIIITDENELQNIFTAGQYVTIRLKKARNIYAAGADISVNTASEIKGAYLAGGNVSFDGTATDLMAAGASVSVSGTIYENLQIRSDDITFGDNITVGGQVTIYASVKPELPNTIDESQVTFKKIIQRDKDNEAAPTGAVSRTAVVLTILGIVTAILIAVLLTAFRGGFYRTHAAVFKQKAWKSLLIGLIAFIVVPIAALLCMLTVIAIPISIIVLILYGIILYLAPVKTGIVLGRAVLPKMNRFLSAGIGTLVLQLLLLIPFVKILLFFLCAFYALGITVVSLKPRGEHTDETMTTGET
jgi:hypothetical protein